MYKQMKKELVHAWGASLELGCTREAAKHERRVRAAQGEGKRQTLNENDLNKVADLRFSLKLWFAAGTHSCRLKKPGSAHHYLTLASRALTNSQENL